MVYHFMIQEGTPHVSSMDLEGLYNNLYSGVIQQHYIKLWTQVLRVPFLDRSIITLSFVSYSSGRMARDKEWG